MSPRCGDQGSCLLPPRHEGFHKSNFHAWPNKADGLERWAAIGRNILLGSADAAYGLSHVEIEYAINAAAKLRATRP